MEADKVEGVFFLEEAEEAIEGAVLDVMTHYCVARDVPASGLILTVANVPTDARPLNLPPLGVVLKPFELEMYVPGASVVLRKVDSRRAPWHDGVGESSDGHRHKKEYVH